MSFLKHLFKGRINRRNYIIGIIFSLVIPILFLAVYFLLTLAHDYMGLYQSPWVFNIAYILMIVLWMGFILSLHIRRSHDLGHSGWLSILLHIPVVGIFCLSYFSFFKGTPEQNRFGHKPDANIHFPRDILNLRRDPQPGLFQLDNSSKKHSPKLLVTLLVSAILIVSISVSYFLGESHATSAQTAPTISPTPSAQSVSAQSVDNKEAVVNIGCDNGEGGSGTMILDGTIVTNNHVINGSHSCLVTIPDTRTGAPTSIYTASPYVVPDLSELYDIAVLKVTGSYTDANTKVWGVYPTSFPIFVKPDTCKDELPKLGDPIRLYGYPVTSGGLNLTITEGIISSFADNGDILTSAKVDSGNSGGLAVNSETGCMLGIPSAVTLTGNYQNLGIIKPMYKLLDFLQKVKSGGLTFQPQTIPHQSVQATTAQTSTDPKIDCVGPDQKHLQVTRQECDQFNAAWNNPPTPTPYYSIFNGWGY